MRNRLLFILAGVAGLIRRKERGGGEDRVAGIAGPIGRKEPHYRDVAVPSRFHFALRLRRRFRNRFKRMSSDEQRRLIAGMKERREDVSVFESDPREHLVQFLDKFGPRTLGPNGTLESLTLLEDTTDSSRRGGRYLAAFANGAKMIWTVVHASDGTISLDGAGTS
jgi:hypothetical protein